MTRLTRALASRSAANVRERVRRATASPRPGAVGKWWDLVRDETGDKISCTLGGVEGCTLGGMAGCTLGAGVGVREGTTLGEGEGALGGAAVGLGMGAVDSDDVSSFHLLKISLRMSMAMC